MIRTDTHTIDLFFRVQISSKLKIPMYSINI